VKIPCDHFIGDGCLGRQGCAIGKFGGKPWCAQCRQCDDRVWRGKMQIPILPKIVRLDRKGSSDGFAISPGQAAIEATLGGCCSGNDNAG
jgi:hypothetical protein